MRKVGPSVLPKDTPRFVYEAIRRLEVGNASNQTIISAILRGESDGSAPLIDTSDFFKLHGRPLDQVAHGSTRVGGNLTLSSTLSATKGLIYLGSAALSAHDETHDRLGLGTVVPTAKLHISTAVVPVITPNSDITPVGSTWGIGGTGSPTTTWGATSTDDNDVSWMWAPGGFANTFHYIMGLNSTLDPSVPVSDWNVTFTVKRLYPLTGGHAAIGGSVHFIITLSDGTRLTSANFNVISLTDVSWSTLSGTFTTTGSGGPNPNSIEVIYVTPGNGGSGDNYVEISYIKLTVGSASGTPLQKWEHLTNSNLLDYVTDSNAQITLQLSGTPPLRLITAPEFAIGTPTVGDIWKAADTIGTGIWIAPAAMSKVDDTNVTLSLTGSPTVALLAATTLTLGWTGVLSTARGGTGAVDLSAFALLAAANLFTTTQDINPATNVPALTIHTVNQTLGSLTSTALSIFNPSGIEVMSFRNSGRFQLGVSGDTSLDGIVRFTINCSPTQTVNLFQATDGTDTLFSCSNRGAFVIGANTTNLDTSQKLNLNFSSTQSAIVLACNKGGVTIWRIQSNGNMLVGGSSTAAVNVGYEKVTIQCGSTETNNLCRFTSGLTGATDLTINLRAVVSTGRIKTAVLFTDDNATVSSAKLLALSVASITAGNTRTWTSQDADGTVAYLTDTYKTPYVAKTGTYTATTADLLIDCTANTFTVTLPTAVGATGRQYIIKNSGAGVITLAANGAQTIDGAATQTIAAGNSITVASNGANWIII